MFCFALVKKQLSQDRLMSLKSASPITLLSSQVLGHRMNPLNLAPNPSSQKRCQSEAERPKEVHTPGLHLLYGFKDVGALCTQKILFLCVILGSEPGPLSLMPASSELFTG